MEEIQRFDDGTIVEEGRKEACPWGPLGRYVVSIVIRRVRTPSGRAFEFNSEDTAIWWGAIWSRTGGTRFIVENGVIPSNVAVLGKPAIATYLSVLGSDIYNIAELLDVSKHTVTQYRTDFINGRR